MPETSTKEPKRSSLKAKSDARADLTRHSSNISGAHLALTNEQGVILFRGIRPRTQLYALEMNGDGGYPRLRFTPIK